MGEGGKSTPYHIQIKIKARETFMGWLKDLFGYIIPPANFNLHSVDIAMYITAWKESIYGVFSGPYFPAFRLNTRKYGPEKAPYLDPFYSVYVHNKNLGCKKN